MASENASLCIKCRSVFDFPDELPEKNEEISYDPQCIIDAAAKGCRVCICHQHTLTKTYGPIENLELSGSLDYIASDPNMVPELLRIYPKDGSDSTSHYTYLKYESTDKNFTVPTSLLAQHTKDQRCLDQVSKWLQDCLMSHESCRNARLTHKYATFPARLLEIGSSFVRLVPKEDIHEIENTHYITLSHRWQADITPKLLRNSFLAMQERIDEKSVPKIFQHSFFLARHLRIKYVWIDALCIIQDDMADLHREITSMGLIYQGALLNIGSLLDQGATKETEVGLLNERDSRPQTPFSINVRCGDRVFRSRACSSIIFEEVARAPLMGRGWVLQERLLSPRSIYFGGQLHWECSERSACEAFPEEKIQPPSNVLLFGPRGPLRITALLSKYGPKTTEESHKAKMYQTWKQIVEMFSSFNLSFEEDYFPAMSGLQSRYAEALQDENLAGLWRGDLTNGLLWYVRHDMHAAASQIYPERYRAPSWSWASVVAPVKFLHFGPSLILRSQKEIMAKVESVRVESDGALNSGRISSGSLRISGYMVQSQKRLSELNTAALREFPSEYEVYDSCYTSDGHRFAKGSFHLALQQYNIQQYDEVGWSGKWKPIRLLEGVIVECVDQRLQTYRRIGVFRHCMEPPADPSDYDEFVDWDPSKSERHTITII